MNPTRLFHEATDSILPGITRILKDGGLCIVPTETVYGLAANALDPVAVGKIFQAKGRPSDNPLIVHVHNFQAVEAVAEIPGPSVRLLFERFSPGPLTIVLPRKPHVPDVTTGGLSTVAVRIPSHPWVRKLLEFSNIPLAAPSANRSGRPSPTDFTMARAEMEGRVDAIVDGGECRVGLESTVVSISGSEWKILRPGAISSHAIQDCLAPLGMKENQTIQKDAPPASPGMKYAHYQPKACVYIAENFSPEKWEIQTTSGPYGLIGILPEIPEGFEFIRDFSDSEHYARDLYRSFTDADEAGIKTLIALDPGPEGIGSAIRNRLFRAAQGRKI